VRTALQTMPVKTDRNHARGIAQLMRLGWFRPVHCKSVAAQETRALLTARKLVQSKLYDIEMSLRGVLRGFGLKVGRTTPKRFALQPAWRGHDPRRRRAREFSKRPRKPPRWERCVRNRERKAENDRLAEKLN
jgi:transposase